MILIFGRTASGKTTISHELERKGLKALESYTTRPARYAGERGHTFVTREESDELHRTQEVVAEVEINGHSYFATAEQVRESDIYVLDPVAGERLMDAMPDERFICISVFVWTTERKRRFLARDASATKEDFDRRCESEEDLFAIWEEEVILPDEDMSINKHENVIAHHVLCEPTMDDIHALIDKVLEEVEEMGVCH